MGDPGGYGMNRRLNLPYDEVVDLVKSQLQAQGFGVLTEIDVRATLKKKLDADWRPYVILGACNPHLAKRALEAELEIGLLLPCNVVVYQEGEGSEVMIADPKAMMDIACNPALGPVAEEARQRLERVLAALGP